MVPKIHGYYQWSNACGYGVHISDCGEQAKLIMNDEDCTVTDWLDIEWIMSDDDDGEYEPVIDPNGYGLNNRFNVVLARVRWRSEQLIKLKHRL